MLLSVIVKQNLIAIFQFNIAVCPFFYHSGEGIELTLLGLNVRLGAYRIKVRVAL